VTPAFDRGRLANAVWRAVLVKVLEYPAAVLLFAVLAVIMRGAEGQALSGPGVALVVLAGALAYFPEVWPYVLASGVVLLILNVAFPRRFLPSAIASVAAVLIFGGVLSRLERTGLIRTQPEPVDIALWLSVAAANVGLVWLSYRWTRPKGMAAAGG